MWGRCILKPIFLRRKTPTIIRARWGIRSSGAFEVLCLIVYYRAISSSSFASQAYLPPISEPEGYPLVIQDLKGKDWSHSMDAVNAVAGCCNQLCHMVAYKYENIFNNEHLINGETEFIDVLIFSNYRRLEKYSVLASILLILAAILLNKFGDVLNLKRIKAIGGHMAQYGKREELRLGLCFNIAAEYIWDNKSAAWPVANPIMTCASITDSRFPRVIDFKTHTNWSIIMTEADQTRALQKINAFWSHIEVVCHLPAYIDAGALLTFMQCVLQESDTVLSGLAILR
ncbi:hypothetical protein M8C21_027301 [Ambrosia artemisiifolia]|uniref:Glucosamine inositolphosphorylceramide transferase 1 N-terminal domain-containing protein n=1 Tax=Ambrosia artemisiifolia TaxID=4212 RepID=A0AAD5BZD4_AMBAR|nr:hypothetical protein M8C21_027301 [Ambrosia artemisiifolia]